MKVMASSVLRRVGAGWLKTFGLGTPLVASLVAASIVGGCDADLPGGTTTVKSGLVSGFGNCGSFADNAMCVCDQINWGGNCTIFTNDIRFYMNLNTSPYQHWNDNIWSINIGPAVKARLCIDAGDNGSCVTNAGLSAEANMKFASWGGDWTGISTIRLDSITDDCNNPQPGQVSIFDDINYNQGTSGDCVVLRPGQYRAYAWDPPIGSNPSYSGGGYGLRDNAVSSLKVGPSTNITLYSNAAYSGSTLNISADPWTTNLVPWLGTSNLNFNDVTSSIVVTSP